MFVRLSIVDPRHYNLPQICAPSGFQNPTPRSFYQGAYSMTDNPGSGSRIALLPVDEARALGKEYGMPSSMSHLNAFRALLNHPELAKAVSGLLLMLLWKANRLDTRLRELIIMRIGWRTGSLYEWTQHWNVARRVAMDEADILAVRDWRASPVLDDADRAVLAATDETLDHGRISDATWRLQSATGGCSPNCSRASRFP
jgi:alkylhydroperoxidase family enzyme